MNLNRIAIAIVALVLCSHASAPAQDMDKELSKLADKLAVLIKDQGKKKVTVLDFTDLQGGGSELGKYIAEELTINLVIAKPDFSVLDRANLRKILTEHKLTATGLVDPENAKKLGMFAGVDALILGTIIPKGTNNVGLTAKIITTDTAEIVGASRAEFQSDAEVQTLSSKPAAVGTLSEKAQVVKSFGDLGVELHSLGIANGREFILDMVLKNQNAKKSIWVSLSPRPDGTSRTLLLDSERFEFQTRDNYVSGILCDELQYGDTFFRVTEIKAGDFIPVSIKFYSWSNRPASAGPCALHLGILLGQSMNGNQGGKATAHNLVAKMEAK